jgi:hypothetical protein
VAGYGRGLDPQGQIKVMITNGESYLNNFVPFILGANNVEQQKI